MTTTTTKVMVALALVGATLAALAVLGHKEVHAERIVEASPAEIWAVLVDAPRYSEWNPVLVEAKGEYGPDAVMTYQMKDKTGAQTEVKATIVKFTKDEEINQRGGIPGILTFDHQWILEPVEGGTRVIQHEEYGGIGVWFWDPSWFQTAYAQGIEALRDRLAQSSGSPEEPATP